MALEDAATREVERLLELSSVQIAVTPHAGEFDDVARLIARVCGAEIGAVTLVENGQHDVKGVFGPWPTSLPKAATFGKEVLLGQGVMEVSDTLLDGRFRDNTVVSSKPFVRFYAGVALRAQDGHSIGTLGIMDRQPRRLTETERHALQIAAAYISARLEVRVAMQQIQTERHIAQSQRDAMSRAADRQKELVDLLVHDLRSPLSSVAANAAFLNAEAEFTQSQREALHDIITATDRLAGMIVDLLQISRAEDGHLMTRSNASVDLAEVAQGAVDRSRTTAATHEVDLRFLGASNHAVVDGDQNVLTRVVINLVDNACKFAPRKSIVEVRLEARDGFAILRVRDEGCGIPEAQRASVFDKYFQVDEPDSQRSGFGLGLSFCKLALEAHRGTIQVENTSHGCSFCVRLPLKASK